MAVSVSWLFLAVTWVSLQCVIVVFQYHTLLFFYNLTNMKQRSNIFVQVIFCEFLGSVPEKQNIHVHFQ